MTAARPESKPQRVSMATLWLGVQKAGACFVPALSTTKVRVPLHAGIRPRDPAGQGPPNSSLLSSMVPAALQAPGRKPVTPMAVDLPGPVPNPPHPEHEPLKRESRGIFGGFSLNLGGRLVAVCVLCSLNPKDVWGRLCASAA